MKHKHYPEAPHPVPPPPLRLAPRSIGHWVTVERHRRACSVGLKAVVVDALGATVDRVRAYRWHSNGVEVRILSTINSGELAVVANDRGFVDLVEFHGFIPSGRIQVFLCERGGAT